MMNDDKSQAKLCFKTIILSDLHLGSPYCQLEKIISFLHSTRSETLILNGDIIDGWSLARKGGWNHRSTRCIRILLDKFKSENTRIIYVRGNHDDFLDKLMPFALEGVEVVTEYIHPTPNGNYLVVHGDGFDTVTTRHRWLSVLGDIGYQTMMWVNAAYNNHCERFKLPHFSISKWIKSKVKSVVSFVDQYEEQLRELAAKRQFRGIICGHIHTPANKHIGSLHYLNSGDWVESNTAIVEHYEGELEVIDFKTLEKWKGFAATQTQLGHRPDGDPTLDQGVTTTS